MHVFRYSIKYMYGKGESISQTLTIIFLDYLCYFYNVFFKDYLLDKINLDLKELKKQIKILISSKVHLNKSLLVCIKCLSRLVYTKHNGPALRQRTYNKNSNKIIIPFLSFT